MATVANDSGRRQDRIWKLWLERNRLLLSRVHTVTAAEAGILTGAFVLWKREGHLELALLLLSVGGLLLVVGSLLMRRDAQYMAACQAMAPGFLPELEKPLFGVTGRCLIRWSTFIVGVGNLVLAVLLWSGG